jgi:hypothetical protein
MTIIIHDSGQERKRNVYVSPALAHRRWMTVPEPASTPSVISHDVSFRLGAKSLLAPGRAGYLGFGQLRVRVPLGGYRYGGRVADSRIRCSTAAGNGLTYARLTYGTSA